MKELTNAILGEQKKFTYCTICRERIYAGLQSGKAKRKYCDRCGQIRKDEFSKSYRIFKRFIDKIDKIMVEEFKK